MKKYLRKSLLLIFVCVIITTGMCACRKKDNEDLIIGYWKLTSDSGRDYMEFFDDGSFVTDSASWCGTYAITGNRLRLTGRLEAIVFDFEFDKNGDRLTLITESGHSYDYERIETRNEKRRWK